MNQPLFNHRLKPKGLSAAITLKAGVIFENR